MKTKRKRMLATSICAVLTVFTFAACSDADQAGKNDVNHPITTTAENSDAAVSKHLPGAQKNTGSFHPAALVRLAEKEQIDDIQNLFSEWGLEQSELLTAESENLNAKDYHIHLKMQSRELSIIELSNPQSSSWRYLFFQNDAEENGWELIDHLDVSGRGPYEPAFRVEEFNNGENVWFVLKRLSGYGTGTTELSEIWYRIGNDGLEEQLQYTTDSHDWMSPSQFVFSDVSAKVNTVKNVYVNDETQFTLNVTYQIALTDSNLSAYNSEDEAKLFETKRSLHYAWNESRDQFELDHEVSDGNENLLQFTPEHIKKHFRAELEELAEHASPQQKAWLEKIEYSTDSVND